MIITSDEAKKMFSVATQNETSDVDKRDALRKQAMKFLYDNQECYVAQWILQNPYANPQDYRLKFVYNDESRMGYTVEMEKIDV